jgi:hypothetical protein
MIITREVINKNIKFCDYDVKTLKSFEYDYNYLSKCIDLYKEFLLSSGIEPQKTVIIGERLGVWQTACLFACYELGLCVAVFDVFADFKVSTINYSNQLKLFQGIDYLLISYEELPLDRDLNYKHFCAKQESKKTLVRYFDHDDLNQSSSNNIILSKENYILTKSLTSGTTGTPRCVHHTHSFLFLLMCRNSNQFYGKYLNTKGLNHGSSIFCYFMPAIISKHVTNFYLLKYFPSYITKEKNEYEIQINNLLKFCEFVGNIDHVATLTSIDLETLLKLDNPPIFTKTNFHVLSYIKCEWVENFYKKNLVKDIISNFGSNETTGPLFLNKSSYENFSETSYKLVDNFFPITVKNDKLEVFIKTYNKIVEVNDKFTIKNNQFIHCGRSDILRINDLQIDIAKYTELTNKYFSANLIFDNVKSEIYLAVWDQYDLKNLKPKVLELNEKIISLSVGKHRITKYSCLNQIDFFGSIKIDMQSLKDYFRSPTQNYELVK